MFEASPRVWQVGALCRAVADALDARFNPVAVRGEISGFSRASSGHCYFGIKDSAGQIRCVMFKRAFSLAGFTPRDGELVEIRGRLDVYDARGDLQLIVESMSQAGPGALFEQFLRRKLKLEAEGLFDPGRKRALPVMPRGIGVVTSLGAAALHDVVSVLRRRVPHVPVVVAAASVQGANAAADIASALRSLYRLVEPVLDAILIVRGGGSMEDLFAFNDEALARVIAQSPVPVISGVGHETDFTISDFVADVRAPTPTAAAELVAQARDAWMDELLAMEGSIQDALRRRLDDEAQRIDRVGARLARPSHLVAAQAVAMSSLTRRLHLALGTTLARKNEQLDGFCKTLPVQSLRGLDRLTQRLSRAELRLGLLDPTLVLKRGYAWLSDQQGRVITAPQQTHAGQLVRATLAEGTLDLRILDGR